MDALPGRDGDEPPLPCLPAHTAADVCVTPPLLAGTS